MATIEPPPETDADSVEATRIAAARRGDVGAFNYLVLAHQELAYNVALGILGDRDAASDVTQDAFVNAFRHVDQFHGGSFRAWLLRIVTNGCYDLIRSRRRHPGESLDVLADDEGFDVPDLGELPEALALRAELWEEIRRGLATLPIDQRAVLILYDVQGLSYDEIALAIDANLGTVKSRLNRARRRLRDYLMAHPELWRA